MIWKLGQTVEIETEHYRLRSLVESDATDRYLQWIKNPDVNQYLEVRLYDSSIQTIKAFISSHDNQSSFLLGMIDKEDNSHVGNYSARCDSYHKTATLGVMIGDRKHWGRRIVIETRSAVLDFLFTQLDILKVHGACYSNNVPAIYNYKAQGFECEGILKSHRFSGNKRVDVMMFAMSRDAWMGARNT